MLQNAMVRFIYTTHSFVGTSLDVPRGQCVKKRFKLLSF